MKDQKLNMRLLLLSLVLVGCLPMGEDKKIDHQTIVDQVYPALFEVVTPKLEDDNVVYDRELPFDKLPFKERNDKFNSIGTAFLISDNRLISAAHVFKTDIFSTTKDYFVRSSKGTIHKVKTIYRYDQYRDVIEFDLESYPEKRTALKLNFSPRLSQTVYTVGNALGEGISTRGGQISAFTPEDVKGAWDYIRYSSPTSPGNSGGPLINSQGEAIGIVVMRIKNEDLNFALPLDQIKKSSLHEATFFSRNVRTNYGKHSLTKDFKTTSVLPSTIEALSKASLDQRNEFHQNLRSELLEKHKKDLFPHSAHFRHTIPEQQRNSDLKFLKYDYNLIDWYYSSVSTTKYVLKDGTTVYKGKIKDYGKLLFIEAKDNLQKIKESTSYLSKVTAKALSFYRRVGREYVNVEDLGDASKTVTWKDSFGRVWKTHFWFLKHSYYFHAIHTTPTPQGLFAVSTKWSDKYFKKAYLQEIKELIDRTLFTYYGTLDEWSSFLSDSKNELPLFLQGFSINRQKSLQFLNQDFSFSLRNKVLNGQNFLRVYPAYELQNEKLSHSLYRLKLEKRRESQDYLSLTYSLKPNKSSGHSYKNQWQNIKGESAVWTGKPKQTGTRLKVYQVLKEVEGKAYLAVCQSNDDSTLWSKGMCEQIKSSFKTP